MQLQVPYPPDTSINTLLSDESHEAHSVYPPNPTYYLQVKLII